MVVEVGKNSGLVREYRVCLLLEFMTELKRRSMAETWSEYFVTLPTTPVLVVVDSAVRLAIVHIFTKLFPNILNWIKFWEVGGPIKEIDGISLMKTQCQSHSVVLRVVLLKKNLSTALSLLKNVVYIPLNN